MSSKPTRIAVMAPAGETPESWAKFKIECLAIAWRAQAKAYFRGWMMFLGWTCCAMLASQIWGPAVVAWIMAHVSVNSMKAVAVVIVAAIFVYQAVERLRCNARRVVDVRQKRAVQA